MSAEALQAIPAAGWALLFVLAAIIGAVFLKKEVRLRNIEVVSRRELDSERRLNSQHDIITLIASQQANARNLLQELRNGICDAGKECLPLNSQARLYALEDVAARVEYRIEREVLQDLIRNHFGGKGEEELRAYSDAKAEGYWQRVKAELGGFSSRFPGQDLACLMERIPIEGYRELFGEIYSAANRIAGEHKGKSP